MSTHLFNSIIVGPIRSRRLGTSLGINLLPQNSKWCNYECVYCECGWRTPLPAPLALPSCQEVQEQLEQKLQALQAANALPDVITFSGNGEPTMHPQFAEIMGQVLRLREQYAPNTRVCVLTNATLIGKPEVREALQKTDITMLKLDAGNNDMLQTINQPQMPTSIDKLLSDMQHFGSRLVIQTMFLRGTINGKPVDNTQSDEVETWLHCIERLHPIEVVLYTLDRETPAEHLKKINLATLESIAQRVRALGIIAKTYE
ncbi:radical SAM protein [Bacteroidia bacterium]|nr:radical SAM protein [Bacteroidia bacterium]